MDLSKYEHIIWDWNGTLLDDVWLCVEINNSLLAERQLPTISHEHYRDIFTFPVKRYYQILGFDFSVEPFETISTEFIHAYEGRRSECSLMSEVHKTLAHITQIGLSQSVLSASKGSYLIQAIHEYGLRDTFVAVNGLNNHHAASKIELGKHFISGSGLQPSTVLLVGDTVHDAEVADSMGIDCCLIPNGHQSPRILKGCGVPLVGSLAELC